MSKHNKMIWSRSPWMELIDPGTRTRAVDFQVSTSGGEFEANARLIAAAPELLQMVIDLSNWLEDIPINYLKHHNHSFKLLDDAKESIAKATGANHD